MNSGSRWLTNALLVVNAGLLAFVAKSYLDMSAAVGGLERVLADGANASVVHRVEERLSLYQEACTHCHTEERFKRLHGTRDEITAIIDRMRAQPDARISEGEAEKIHASLVLLKCQQCHSGEMMAKLSLMNPDYRLGVVQEMARKPGSEIPVGEAGAILSAWKSLLEF